MRARMKENPEVEYWIDSEDDPESDFSRIREDQDFYIDDENIVHIETSECEKIIFQCDKHPSKKINAEGDTFTGTQLQIKDDWEYIRATVVDKEGRKAWTNPIFIK